MANEYLQRTPTSTGNTRVWTWSGWLKLNDTAAAPTNIFMARTIAGGADYTYIDSNAGEIRFADDAGYANNTTRKIRDSSGWFHLLCNLNTTSSSGDDRMNIYINGALESNLSSASNPVINYQATVNTIILHTIGNNSNGQYGEYNITDVFLVDGQALTPDVFGFYKQGKGYISVGSIQATDFRPGQWVPKTPRVIKTEINRRGGFGVNGFYLPMNDSRNFGADFHGDPNSIITLNEKLPQPRVGVASTASVGLGYADALRADPYAANLVLALPFVSGGLSSGFGDYAPSIKGSGSVKVGTLNGNVAIANTASYYGNSAFFDGNGDYITIPSNSDFSFGTGDFTVEFWMRRFDTGTNTGLLDTRTTNTDGNGWFIRFNASTTIQFVDNATQYVTITHSSDWNHVAFVRKSGVLTGYINGVAAGISTTVTKNFTSSNFLLGGFVDVQSSPNAYNGYLQDLRVYKGVAKYTGGFDVPRPYTPVGIATWRQVPDTTANNFATLNPLSSPNDAGLSNGNLDYNGPSAWRVKRGTIQIPTTGKWYFEVRLKGSGANNSYNGSYAAVGLCTDLAPVDGTAGISTTSNLMLTDTGIVKNFTSAALSFLDNTTNTGSALSSGDIISLQIDRDANTYNFLKNGTSINSGTMNITAGTPLNVIYISYSNQQGQMTMNFGQNPTFSGNTTAGTFTDTNGKGLFKYQPPSGFLALCEDNLPTPTISDPGKYFRSVLWTGDGNSGRGIVGVGFTPDLVWIKSRSPSAYNHRAFDSVRGAGRDNFLMPNSTAAEGASSDYYGGISSFNSDGFSMVYGTGGSNIGINESGTNFVAWCWRAGAGTTSTNTNGSITSVVSVNQDAGFSIVSYTGNGLSNATVGHGLGRTPALIIHKNRDIVTSWLTLHRSIATPNPFTSTTWAVGSLTGGAVQINLTNAGGTYTMDGQTNGSGNRHIAYCWAEIEGFSKFGSYSGNNSTDGPFVYCGFKPAWVMLKRSDSTGNWCMHDSSRSGGINVMNEQLQANLSNAESGTGGLIDFLSNGFKIRATSTDLNASGGTYIFAAWAESPFQTANAK